MEIGTDIFALLHSAEGVVGADDVIRCDIHNILDKSPYSLTFTAGNDIDCEVVFIEIGNNFHHGQVEGLACLQVGKAFDISFVHVICHVGLVLFRCHTSKYAGESLVLEFIHLIGYFMCRDGFFEFGSTSFFLGGRRISRVVLQAMDVEHPIEIEGCCFAEQGSVAIKNCDAVFDGNEVFALFVGYVLYISNKLFFSWRISSPIVKVFGGTYLDSCQLTAGSCLGIHRKSPCDGGG